ncbi:unnamed protein product [Vicia faba]|uniref:Uncharacterized protein n=1 Tax=Vicia faba TaxID=3906 RepID=A0AAV0ZIR9_VICFA|nr:unnamed protein product [Vicia faba]
MNEKREEITTQILLASPQTPHRPPSKIHEKANLNRSRTPLSLSAPQTAGASHHAGFVNDRSHPQPIQFNRRCITANNNQSHRRSATPPSDDATPSMGLHQPHEPDRSFDRNITTAYYPQLNRKDKRTYNPTATPKRADPTKTANHYPRITSFDTDPNRCRHLASNR